MDAIETMRTLTSQMSLEPAEDLGCPPLSERKQKAIFISPAVLPNGKRIDLLKTQLSSACERDCYYCPFRAGRDFRRATFKPDEFAKTFMALHRAGIAQGLFLSSAISQGGVTTQDNLIASAEILRHKLGYRGYIHLKIMPGAEKDQVIRLMQLADRVSVNLEAPNASQLVKLAPHKTFIKELLQPLRWVDEIRRTHSPVHTWNGRWPSSVTQFVVGAVGESDFELLSTSEALYHQAHLRRIYYSRFNPIPDTPFENLPGESPLRENHLYQSSFLLRDYGFNLEELPFDTTGNLPRHTDPKLAWAQLNLATQPVEINRADRESLLRVPGIGLKGAQAILTARRQRQLQDLSSLRRMGVNPQRAAPFILLNGHRPAFQMTFFQ